MKDKIVIDKNVWYTKEKDYATEPTSKQWEPLTIDERPCGNNACEHYEATAYERCLLYIVPSMEKCYTPEEDA